MEVVVNLSGGVVVGGVVVDWGGWGCFCLGEGLLLIGGLLFIGRVVLGGGCS